MGYFIHLAIMVCIYLILAESFNLTFGLGGLFNLAHIATYAIGAYATALLSTELGLGFWSCLLASMSLSALFALLIGAISLKLRHDYFAIGTLAFSAIVSALLINWRSLTRGVLGIPGIPRPEVFGFDLYENDAFFPLVFAIAAITCFFFYCAFKSPFARKLRMLSESQTVGQALAVELKATRNDSFIISSAFAGLSGSLFAYYISYIDPSSFGLNEMVFVLSIVVVGRPGSFWGVVLSTVFLVLLPEPLRFIDMPSSVLGPMRQLLYSAILFLSVYAKRETLFPVQRVI